MRSYVEERPVSERSVARRACDIERRPVDPKLSSADLSGNDLLREGLRDARKSEEAVIGKKHACGEVVVRKTAENVENVQDPVRETSLRSTKTRRAAECRQATNGRIGRRTDDEEPSFGRPFVGIPGGYMLILTGFGQRCLLACWS